MAVGNRQNMENIPKMDNITYSRMVVLESGNQSIPEKGFLTRVEAEEYASTCNCYSFDKKYRHVFTQEISRLIEIGTTR